MTENEGLSEVTDDQMDPSLVEDPLGLGGDLNEVDTSMPTLVEGLYELVVDKVEPKPNKAGDGRNLVVTFKTTAPATSVQAQEKGEEDDIKAGFPITCWWPLQQSDNPDAPDFKERHAQFQDAVLGTEKGNRPPYNPFAYVGARIIARLKVTKDDEYGLGNDVRRMTYIDES